MVFTHLPSNLLLALDPVRADRGAAFALLLARYALSQMDVPTRQAYVVGVVDPDERAAAAAYTNTARYVARPLGPLVAAPIMQVSLGAPFVIAGVLKSVYDLGLYVLFRAREAVRRRAVTEDAEQHRALTRVNSSVVARRRLPPRGRRLAISAATTVTRYSLGDQRLEDGECAAELVRRREGTSRTRAGRSG